jgi:hypothetical protein
MKFLVKKAKKYEKTRMKERKKRKKEIISFKNLT